MLDQRKAARVLFDEAHSEAWTIRPDAALAMQPAHPGDSSYALAAQALADRDFAVAANLAGPLTEPALRGADVLVIAHPSDPRWERTTGAGASPRLAPEEIDAIEAWVHAGGGLILLGETEQEKYGNNLDELAGRFGIRISSETVTDYERFHVAPSWVLADLPGGAPASRGARRHGLLARVSAACFYRATTLECSDRATVVASTSATASVPGAALAAVASHGHGRVAVLADSDLFGDDCLGELDHEALWLNLVYWTAGPAFAAQPAPAASAASADPHWTTLKSETDQLRLLQDADGSVDLGAHDGAAVSARVERIAAAILGLAPRFQHQAGYLDAVCADLGAWAAGGFAKPDFAASLELFRPDADRRDGAEHLVVFPMYLQNASRDTRFEALIVRVPWPEWLSELESTRYDNAKFVPVTFVDNTAGYDSECAVLFPETVAVAERGANHFGAIFCDREAERFRRVVTRAAETLSLELPPDAAALLSSPALSEDAFALWDLIHDRAHSHGDLPFDPFMIRQRMPYWMYSLEELRCDLTAFAEAQALEGEGLHFARHVQYAILFDRLFRFPITGTRTRNYDGLGGQLLFAYLHKHTYLHWTDNRLSIEWDRVADGVRGLRAEVETLYREGIDRSRVTHWATAHELVARYVPATTASRWTPGARPLSDESDPKAWIDLVEDDEFPLSIFYSSLKQKLESEPVALPA
jgi:hypothetical protein